MSQKVRADLWAAPAGAQPAQLSPLLSTCYAASRIGFGTPGQKRHWLNWVSSVAGHHDGEGTWRLALWGEDDPGEKKASGDLNSSPPLPSRSYQEDGAGTFKVTCGVRDNRHNLKQKMFRLGSTFCHEDCHTVEEVAQGSCAVAVGGFQDLIWPHSWLYFGQEAGGPFQLELSHDLVSSICSY